MFVADRQAAYLAERDGNYGEALRIYRAIEGYLATTPDQERDGNSQSWRSDIAQHIARLERLVRGAQGIVANKIEYQRPGLCHRS